MDRRALLLTRPQDSAERFVARLPAEAMEGIETCISPLLEIVSTGEDPDLNAFRGVIFTSARAVALVPKGDHAPAYCVGAQTAKAAQARGWAVERVAQTADELVAMMHKAAVTGPLIHLAGAHRRGEIAARMIESGTVVDVVTLYEQRLKPLTEKAQTLLSGEAPVIVPLFSPRTAQQFADQARDMHRAIVVAISPAVAEVIDAKAVANLLVAEAPTGDEMTRTVEMLLRKDTLA